jgi:hypothetical protein
MKRMIFAVLMAVMISRQAFAFQCDELQPMLKYLLAERHLGFLSTAIDDKANVYMFFVNPQNGSWAVMHVDENLHACILMQGSDWEFILTKGV